MGVMQDMRNYQRQKNNPHKLPHALYMRMLYLIRDYERLKNVEAAEAERTCEMIETAFEEIPEEYRKGIKDNICFGAPYPYTANRNTYSYWRVRLLYALAEKTGSLDGTSHDTEHSQ